MLRLLILVTTLALSCSPAAPAQEAIDESASSAPGFGGAYEFVQLETPDGPSTTQRGHMVVSGDYVCHVRVQKERPSRSQDDADDVQQQKAAQLFGSTTAACGSFSITGDRLTANWITSSDPSVEANQTEFILTMEGDQVTLAPAASPQFKFVYRKLQ